MNDTFELIEPKANLWIGTLLQVIIISIEGDWVEWYFEAKDDLPNAIMRSQIRIEDNGKRTRRYFKYDGTNDGKMFYLDEFNYHWKDKLIF